MLKHVLPELHSVFERVECHDPVISFRGGFANVHQGRLANGCKVAIKMERCQDNGSTIKASSIVHVRWVILTLPQRILCEVHVWSNLCHENIVPLLGFTLIFSNSISLVSPWQENGNAHAYVQDCNIDPRPLVS